MENEINLQHWLIELLAFWEGSVQPGMLARHWHCTRQHAGKILKSYNQQNHQSLVYDDKAKSYQPDSCFKGQHIDHCADEYLNWLTGYYPHRHPQLATLTINPPPRHITPQLMRPLVRALREGRRVEVDYGSITSAARNGRVIVPHHLVKTSTRWHLRAWCEEKQQFRDFVLSRFHGTPELLGKSQKTAADDTDWNTWVKIILKPDPRLDEQRREIMQLDYGMNSDFLELESRGCLVNYRLQGLNLDPTKLEASAKAQQLVIVNLDDIKPWLFS